MNVLYGMGAALTKAGAWCMQSEMKPLHPLQHFRHLFACYLLHNLVCQVS